MGTPFTSFFYDCLGSTLSNIGIKPDKGVTMQRLWRVSNSPLPTKYMKHFPEMPTSRVDKRCDLLRSNTAALPLSLSSLHSVFHTYWFFPLSREVLLVISRGPYSSLYALTSQPQLRRHKSLVLTFPSGGETTPLHGKLNISFNFHGHQRQSNICRSSKVFRFLWAHFCE